MTQSMNEAITETNRRREKQIAYNKQHGITPKTIEKSIQESISDKKMYAEKEEKKKTKSLEELIEQSTNREELINDLTAEMKDAAENLDFERAAWLRDQITKLRTG